MVAMCSSLMAMATNAITQAPSSDEIAFDRPEDWAMKYFASATTLSGLSTDPLHPGSFAIQFERGWLPTLSADQERVGGTAPEDLTTAPGPSR